MNSTETHNRAPSEQNGNENHEKDIDMARIKAMVTPEQEHSADVARKRRIVTRNRTSSANRTRNREKTPVRQVSNEESENRPKTPERRRRKVKGAKQNGSAQSLVSEGKDKESGGVGKSKKYGKQILDEMIDKGDILADRAQNEVKAIFSRTKKTLAAAANRGRELRKKRNKELMTRSRSAPQELTDEQSIELYKQEQCLSLGSYTFRKYSDSSLISSITPDEPIVPKPFRPEVQEFVRRRRKEREYSNKIVEILDPKTSNIITTKTVFRHYVGLREFIFVLRVFPILEIRRQYKLYKAEMRNECQKIKAMWRSCLLKLMIIMIFCGLGGMIFRGTEGSFENFYKCGVKRVKRDFIDHLWIKSHNLREEDWKSLARTKLRTFEEELHAAHEAGMTTYSGQRAWTFLNGIVYCLTIITTIGYGHLYPTTAIGRAITIVYSIIGIPLFLLALTDFGKLFTRGIKFLWSFVRRLYYTGSCRRVRKTAHMEDIFKGAQMMYEIATFRRPSMFADPENPPTPGTTTIGEDTPTTPALSNFEIDDEFNLPISVAIFLLVAYIFLGALIYCMWEGWNFFTSFYFVFISMSTIGFGDYVPRNPICMIVSIVYLVFGLALMSMCINVVQLKLSDTFKHASVKIGATMGIRVSEDDGSISTVPPDQIEIPGIHDSKVEGDDNQTGEKANDGNFEQTTFDFNKKS